MDSQSVASAQHPIADPKTKQTDRLPVVDPNKNKDQMKPVQAIWKGNELLEVTSNRSRAISGSGEGVQRTGHTGLLVRWVVHGFGLVRRLFGALFGRKTRFIRVQDTLNATGHHFSDVEFVDRWGLVEFGITCPRCEKVAAAQWQFDRIVETNTGEGIFCPECGALLLACPTTEKEEHLLPYTKDLEKFARERHALSPHSSEEASKIRMQRAAEKAERLADPMAVVAKAVDEAVKRSTQSLDD